uniref:Uncharacterized protein n=1 Tax=Anguilla anguilla TaxID=7936 RepID=A0A0E9QJ90_ANGAN
MCHFQGNYSSLVKKCLQYKWHSSQLDRSHCKKIDAAYLL